MTREWWADGPEDDREADNAEALIDADDAFAESFATKHASQIISLITSADSFETDGQVRDKVRRLNDELRLDAYHELRERALARTGL